MPQLEKQMYQAAIVLLEGFDNGQHRGLTLMQYTNIAHIYNYFSDFEIQQSGPIR